MQSIRLLICLNLLIATVRFPCCAEDQVLSEQMTSFLGDHCFECHDSETTKANLNLESLSISLSDRGIFDQWVLIHDRIEKGEMPPAKRQRPKPDSKHVFLNALSDALVEQDHANIRLRGRARIRRINRYEYENCLREGLRAPWLQVADKLPEDGIAHLFNKSGERLDVSHVQMAKYLETAMDAL